MTNVTQKKMINSFLAPTAKLSNQYFLLRHGKSYANQKGLIISDPNHDLSGYGLTPRGRREVKTRIERAKHNGTLEKVDLIISSPFLRTLQSAEIAAGILRAPIEIDKRLRERGFGELELTDEANYETVWARDRENLSHTEWGVESVVAVLQRTVELTKEIEARMRSRAVLLCTHGDVASILVCAFLNESLRHHREVGAMGTGDIRRLVLQR